MSTLSAVEWDEYLTNYPEIHLLQTSMWGDLKSGFGWKPMRVANHSAGAQILFRTLPFGFSIAYIPKGPVGHQWESLWPEIHAACRSNRAVFLRVEPDLNEPWDTEYLKQLPGFARMDDTIQPRQTIIIDLNGSPDDWLSRMKQKTRYNIRLAEKKDVHVAESRNFDAFSQLMQTTGERDGFGVHTLAYYQKAYELFEKHGSVALLQADFENHPLAMLMVFACGERAYYLYGASGDEERQRMPAYLLQFETMRWAASKNCKSYDLWGIPDAPEAQLEANFENRHDGLWGVYRFKRGFGGRIVRSVPGFDFVYQPLLYRLIRRRMLQGRGG